MGRRRTIIGTLSAWLVLAAVGMLNAQATGTRKMSENQAWQCWENFLTRCGDRVFLVEDGGTYNRITEYRGNVHLEGMEFILDRSYAAANRIEAKGTLIIRAEEFRTCQFSGKKPEWIRPWSVWEKPMDRNGGMGFAFTRRDGRIQLPSEYVKATCEVIERMDAYK